MKFQEPYDYVLEVEEVRKDQRNGNLLKHFAKNMQKNVLHFQDDISISKQKMILLWLISISTLCIDIVVYCLAMSNITAIKGVY